MRCLGLFIAIAICTLSCKNTYYTGNIEQDSLIKHVDNKLNSAEKVYVVWSKRIYQGDSMVSYATNRANNELLTFALLEKNADRITYFHLLKGELVKVQYIPDRRKNTSNFYFFENGKLLYKRQRIADSTEAQKFLDDIISLKRTFKLN